MPVLRWHGSSELFGTLRTSSRGLYTQKTFAVMPRMEYELEEISGSWPLVYLRHCCPVGGLKNMRTRVVARNGYSRPVRDCVHPTEAECA